MAAKLFTPGVGFPARLDAILAHKGLTYRQVYEKTGVTPTTLSNWRLRRYYPEQRTFIRFCSKLRLDPHKLLRLPGEEPLVLRSAIDLKFRPILKLVQSIKGEVPGMDPDERIILASLLTTTLEDLQACLAPFIPSTTQTGESLSDSSGVLSSEPFSLPRTES